MKELKASLGISIAAWTGIMMLFAFTRYYGVEEEAVIQLTGSQRDLRNLILFQGFILGISFGIALGILDVFLDRKVLRRATYVQMLLLRTLAHVLVTLPITAVVILISHRILGEETVMTWNEILLSGPFSKSALVLIIYSGVVSIFFNLIRQINAMFGPGILYKLIVGRYYRPQEERRIFMFLDLRSSTTYAERLGHVRYSELIQDCFSDLTLAVRKHQVEIYQYVGDEAVLTWKIDDGLRNANCLWAYFTFEATIQKRADYYFHKYGLVPVFKAGMNAGPVMAAEVGVVKKEIAYHSDVLNTAARIQGRCNELSEMLLISEELYELVGEVKGLHITPAGIHELKGKMQSTKIYRVAMETPLVHRYAFSE